MKKNKKEEKSVVVISGNTLEALGHLIGRIADTGAEAISFHDSRYDNAPQLPSQGGAKIMGSRTSRRLQQKGRELRRELKGKYEKGKGRDGKRKIVKDRRRRRGRKAKQLAREEALRGEDSVSISEQILNSIDFSSSD